MTQEEKQLLLQDLCERLPYGVKVDAYQYSTPQTLYSIDVFRGEYILENGDSENLFVRFDKSIFSNIKPYLRMMSSMTEEERKELAEKGIYIDDDFDICYDAYEDRNISLKYVVSEYVDWLNAHHFDYCGLIEKGLALEAPEGMYNTKTE